MIKKYLLENELGVLFIGEIEFVDDEQIK